VVVDVAGFDTTMATRFGLLVLTGFGSIRLMIFVPGISIGFETPEIAL
jgi:hypothetical protein